MTENNFKEQVQDKIKSMAPVTETIHGHRPENKYLKQKKGFLKMVAENLDDALRILQEDVEPGVEDSELRNISSKLFLKFSNATGKLNKALKAYRRITPQPLPFTPLEEAVNELLDALDMADDLEGSVMDVNSKGGPKKAWEISKLSDKIKDAIRKMQKI